MSEYGLTCLPPEEVVANLRRARRRGTSPRRMFERPVRAAGQEELSNCNDRTRELGRVFRPTEEGGRPVGVGPHANIWRPVRVAGQEELSK